MNSASFSSRHLFPAFTLLAGFMLARLFVPLPVLAGSSPEQGWSHKDRLAKVESEITDIKELLGDKNKGVIGRVGNAERSIGTLNNKKTLGDYFNVNCVPGDGLEFTSKLNACNVTHIRVAIGDNPGFQISNIGGRGTWDR